MNDFQLPDVQRLRKITDQCVLCGMCAPHCPTYGKTMNEAESPRGRISLMQAILSDQLAASDSATTHLDNCLICRNCERICPSGVAYGELIDGMRAILSSRGRSPSPVQQQILQTVASPLRLRLGARLMHITRGTGLSLWMRWAGQPAPANTRGWQQLISETPKQHPWKPQYPALGSQRGSVALFLGCVANVLDQASLDAAIGLLRHCGYRVLVPARQDCCGALHYHSGDRVEAGRLAEKNASAFAITGLDAVISLASGCSSHLLSHPHADTPTEKVFDILDFLQRHGGLSSADFLPLPRKVAVHEPCSLRNGLRQESLPYRLLALIPELELVPLPGNSHCCGAAGSYMLEHPTMADALLTDKLDAIGQVSPDILVSNNIGCALHLAAGLRQNDQPIEVLHPVSLLARQLSRNTS